jgi:hypothetical protein
MLEKHLSRWPSASDYKSRCSIIICRIKYSQISMAFCLRFTIFTFLCKLFCANLDGFLPQVTLNLYCVNFNLDGCLPQIKTSVFKSNYDKYVVALSQSTVSITFSLFWSISRWLCASDYNNPYVLLSVSMAFCLRLNFLFALLSLSDWNFSAFYLHLCVNHCGLCPWLPP